MYEWNDTASPNAQPRKPVDPSTCTHPDPLDFDLDLTKHPAGKLFWCRCGAMKLAGQDHWNLPAERESEQK